MPNQSVYAFRVEGSTIKVNGKCNNIILDTCKKTAVVLDSAVSSVEFINCQSVQMQVMGSVPTISIDKTDGCQMYLSKDSLHAEIISAKSSEMNVLIPNGEEFVRNPLFFPSTFNHFLHSGRATGAGAVQDQGAGHKVDDDHLGVRLRGEKVSSESAT